MAACLPFSPGSPAAPFSPLNPVYLMWESHSSCVICYSKQAYNNMHWHGSPTESGKIHRCRLHSPPQGVEDNGHVDAAIITTENFFVAFIPLQDVAVSVIVHVVDFVSIGDSTSESINWINPLSTAQPDELSAEPVLISSPPPHGSAKIPLVDSKLLAFCATFAGHELVRPLQPEIPGSNNTIAEDCAKKGSWLQHAAAEVICKHQVRFTLAVLLRLRFFSLSYREWP